MSLFTAVEMAPRDPILGITEQFAADAKPAKVNLGVGVYYDDNGKLPLLKCVQAAEKTMMDSPKARGYLPIDGIAAYDAAVKSLVFGADSEPVRAGRVATVQAIGGTGGLKVGADFLRKLDPAAKVLISDPSWENHRALFGGAGFVVDSYPYYDAAKRGVNFDGMLAALNAAAPGTIIVLHACCHNPTGYDITAAQWDQVVAAVMNDPALRALWEQELGEMRLRIKAMRQKLVDGLKAAGVKQDMGFITSQIGMFSYSGLSKDQMVRLRKEFGVYGTDTGRMCVAALNSRNIDHVCASIAKVI